MLNGTQCRVETGVLFQFLFIDFPRRLSGEDEVYPRKFWFGEVNVLNNDIRVRLEQTNGSA